MAVTQTLELQSRARGREDRALQRGQEEQERQGAREKRGGKERTGPLHRRARSRGRARRVPVAQPRHCSVPAGLCQRGVWVSALAD